MKRHDRIFLGAAGVVLLLCAVTDFLHGVEEGRTSSGPFAVWPVGITTCIAVDIHAVDVDEAFRIQRGTDWTSASGFPSTPAFDEAGITPTCGTYLLERMQFDGERNLG